MSIERTLLSSLALAAALLVLHGCEDEELVRPDRNSPPETVLSVAPQMGERVFHKYLVRWSGFDRDGIVVAYRVASVAERELYAGRTSPEDIVQYLLGLDWRVTDATESLFVFRADQPNSRSHSVYVAAVDNEGKPDATPAVTNFTAVDYGLPNVWIKIKSSLDASQTKMHRDTLITPIAQGDTIPWYDLDDPSRPILIKIFWGGVDPDGYVTAWRYRLDSSAEASVPEDVDSVAYAYDPTNLGGGTVGLGFHEFRLVAIDDANARSSERVARFVINYDPDTAIDSVWTFRKSKSVNVPERLIYPTDTTAVAYHFGQLRFKFRASDRDVRPGGAQPDTFSWQIKGSLLTSAPDWFKGDVCGDRFCDVVDIPDSVQGPFLDTDIKLTLVLRARDEKRKSDGSPATFSFYVNYSPRILGISHEELEPGTVRFTWDSVDPDEDTGRGVTREQALMKYRYKIDGSIWYDVSEMVGNFYAKRVTVEGLAPGPHTLTLRVFNGVYFETRQDTREYAFEL